MRICFLGYYPLPQSPNSAAYSRLAYLSRRHEVHVLTTRDAAIPDGIGVNVRVHRMPWPAPPLPGDLRHLVGIVLFGIYAVMRVTALRIRGRVDFVYTFHNSECLVAWLLKVTRLRWVVDAFDVPQLNEGDSEYLARKRRFYFRSLRRWLSMGMRRALPAADLVITVAMGRDEGGVRILRDDFHVKESRLLAVPNGVDLSLVRFAPLATGGPGFHLLYVGFVSPRRGVDTLFEACALARAAVPDLQLHLVGPANPEDETWLTAETARHLASEWVHYEGPQPHARVLQCIKDADVCVYPFPQTIELDNVLPIKLFEYLAVGRPVIATGLSGASRIIQEGWNGLLVEPGSSRAMADAILRLYSDEKLRARLAANARPSVETYDWSTIHPKIEQAMLQVARK